MLALHIIYHMSALHTCRLLQHIEQQLTAAVRSTYRLIGPNDEAGYGAIGGVCACVRACCVLYMSLPWDSTSGGFTGRFRSMVLDWSSATNQNSLPSRKGNNTPINPSPSSHVSTWSLTTPFLRYKMRVYRGQEYVQEGTVHAVDSAAATLRPGEKGKQTIP
jgi:hypothetical protein